MGFSREKNPGEWSITKKGDLIRIKAGMLQRSLTVEDSGNIASYVLLNGSKITDLNSELSFTLWKAFPNAEPVGIEYASESGIEQVDAVKNQTDALKVKSLHKEQEQFVKWIDSTSTTGIQMHTIFDSCFAVINSTNDNADRLTLYFKATKNKAWKGLTLEIIYEIYKDHPAIRKWVRFSNDGSQWLKVSNLMIDPVVMKRPYTDATLLTPAVRGIDPCMVALSDSEKSIGIIQVSEIPSKLRFLAKSGVSGYNPDYFEWVMGPGESFESEAVFMYAFEGKNFPTTSSVSYALDRCVEGEFRTFLKKRILMPFDDSKIVAPLFCTWTNYSAEINDNNMREAADIASRIGFNCFQLDAGWSNTGPSGGWAVSTRNPDRNKFTDLKGVSEHIRDKGMKTGLWYSVFINEEQADKMTKTPVLFSLPLIRRAGGLGISFTCKAARDNYVNDILFLNKTYNAGYFKQDLSSICYGDIARGHESRTLKESYLRGLRGLFLTQDQIHKSAPDVYLQMSHEIYWETPGPAADVAVLKHVDAYHISPNEYWGAGKRSKRVDADWNLDRDSLSAKLIQGCLSARNLMYFHRGLPLERLEVFGAVTTDYNGSLTPAIQNRQICSWLMGSPLSFSGDLGSLTEENIGQYRNGFETVKRLQQEYGIYSYYQYSGVPEPTDLGWHWWGKLNEDGYGAVVILRGNEGSDTQCINIPWVLSSRKYRLKGLFSGKELGVFTGKQLQKGELSLSLRKFDQEIVEVAYYK